MKSDLKEEFETWLNENIAPEYKRKRTFSTKDIQELYYRDSDERLGVDEVNIFMSEKGYSSKDANSFFKKWKIKLIKTLAIIFLFICTGTPANGKAFKPIISAEINI